MAGVLKDCTINEQRVVVYFLWAKGRLAEDVHMAMFLVCGKKCLWRMAVYKFAQGCSTLLGSALSGCCLKIATNAVVAKVAEIISAKDVYKLMIFWCAVRCPHGLAYIIVYLVGGNCCASLVESYTLISFSCFLTLQLTYWLPLVLKYETNLIPAVEVHVQFPQKSIWQSNGPNSWQIVKI